MATPHPQPDSARIAATASWRWVAIWLLLVVIGASCEAPRWWTPEARTESLAGWLCGRSPDYLPCLVWLLLAPLCVWLAPSMRRADNPSRMQRWLRLTAADSECDWGTVTASVLLALLGAWFAIRSGITMAGLPPAYHDEYSYQLQAETFRAGRTWFPVQPALPQLFDQMHVLNEPDLAPPTGRFASRYFPGTGLWLAPFVQTNPVAGQYLAQTLLVVGMFWIGRELGNNGVGLLAAVLAAVSPGLLLFSNLLLAHHPTLVGLTLFFWMYLRAQRTGTVWSCLLSGTGLAFAMLCRPMTAAGASLPAGVFFGWWWLTGQGQWLRGNATQPLARRTLGQRSQLAIALGGPLIVGLIGMLWYQHSITGEFLTSPYQIYTDRYTPRHGYGFNNVLRGEQQLGPKVIDHYDRWAENLTPPLAAQNVGLRLIYSWRWTLGILPLLGVTLIWLLIPATRHGTGWWLVISAIISLHVVHIPYWFSGIMHWHYVFETAPLWLLLGAAAVHSLMQIHGLRWWTIGFIGLTITTNLLTVTPLWPARIELGTSELLFAQTRYADFRQQIETARRGDDVLVLVVADPADRSLDYVTNPANLTGPVLVGRWRGESLDAIRAAFPNRTLLQFDARTRTLTR